MTYKQIEASREIRLWIGQIIVPAAIAIGTALSIPEVRQYVANKFRKKNKTVDNVIRFEKN